MNEDLDDLNNIVRLLTDLSATQMKMQFYAGRTDELREATRWRPVSETPVLERRQYLVWTGYELQIGYFFPEGWADQYNEPLLITHWMPLPQPPKEEEPEPEIDEAILLLDQMHSSEE
jgi:hypothetical protein